ncbi:MAG: atpC [Candidatus Saccharibacteria bacterium]|nr:atpC [Candidatus Saccharibacteria bacterium]
MKHQKDDTQLRVIARAPFQVYYEGQARIVTASNRIGRFDILPGHADFFSVIIGGDVAIQTDTETITFPTTGGVVGVRGDEVMLFVNM